MKSLKILQVQPTNKCNLYCMFCDHRKVGEELTDEKWREIVDEAGKMNVNRLTITGGGEPLVRRNTFIKMVLQAKKYDIKGDVVTNGTLFDYDLIKKIVKAQWDDIVISIHGANAGLDNKMRGNKKAFLMTMKSIKKINQIKKAYNSELPHLGFLTVLTKYNYLSAWKIVKLAYKLKVDCVSFKLVNENSFTQGKFSIKNIKKLMEIMEKSLNLGEKYSVKVFTDFNIDETNSFSTKTDAEKKENKFFCVVPFFEMVIFSDGSCAPCCVFYEREGKNENGEIKKICDNIYNKSLSDVWYGEKLNELRRRMEKKTPPKVCLECPPDTRYRNETWKRFLNKENIRYL